MFCDRFRGHLLDCTAGFHFEPTLGATRGRNQRRSGVELTLEKNFFASSITVSLSAWKDQKK